MKPIKKFSQLLKEKKAVGTFCEIPSPVVTSFLADGNLDYVLIDNEHALINIETLQTMVMSMQGKDTQCAVRVPSITYDALAPYCDLGVSALFIPQIRTKEDMETIKNACFFPPLGKKGIGPGRISSFGRKLYDVGNDYLKFAPSIFIQIETKESIDNLDGIMAYDFFDGIFIGPMDLSMNFGMFTQYDNPILIKTIEKVYQKAKDSDKLTGMYCNTADECNHWFDKGFDFTCVSSDTFFMNNAIEYALKKIKI